MPDKEERSWPLAPDGTTDWELVFEDEETGLIALIEQAQTTKALRQCAVVVIDQLFIRKNDASNRVTFCSELDSIVSAQGVALDAGQVRTGVSALLRRIKDERINKAADYVARQKTGETGEERRIPNSDPLGIVT